jgi:hypothetical protein
MIRIASGLIRLSSLLCLYSGAVTAQPANNKDFVVQPFTAQYEIQRKSDRVGKATRQLTWLANGTAQYSYHTDIKIFFISDKRTETSIVALSGNKIIPKHYQYKRTGTGKDKAYEWRFDADKNTATNVKKTSSMPLDFSQDIQDSLSYHLQNRVDLINNPEQKHFSYPVFKSNGSIKDYAYHYDGEEQLKLPYGEIKALRFKRANKKRTTYVWFAPKLNYLLVKLRKLKSGKEQFQALLSQVQGNTLAVAAAKK